MCRRAFVNNCFKARNAHLLVSSVLVVSAGLMYGLSPATALPVMFDIRVETVDLANVFRVIMCIYLAVAAVWIAGMVKPSLWRAATIANILFMASLTSGRIISLVFDGVPSVNLVLALVCELLLAAFGVIQWWRFSRSVPGLDGG